MIFTNTEVTHSVKSSSQNGHPLSMAYDQQEILAWGNERTMQTIVLSVAWSSWILGIVISIIRFTIWYMQYDMIHGLGNTDHTWIAWITSRTWIVRFWDKPIWRREAHCLFTFSFIVVSSSFIHLFFVPPEYRQNRVSHSSFLLFFEFYCATITHWWSLCLLNK